MVRTDGRNEQLKLWSQHHANAVILSLLESDPDVGPQVVRQVFGTTSGEALADSEKGDRPTAADALFARERIETVARRVRLSPGFESVTGLLPSIFKLMRRDVSLPARAVAVLGRVLNAGFKMPKLGFRDDSIGPPRRDWGDMQPDLFFPPMNLDWLEGQAQLGLLGHRDELRYAIPKEAIDTYSPPGVYGRLYNLIGATFERKGAAEPVQAAAVLRHARTTSRFPDPETDRVTAEEKRDSWLIHTILNGKQPMPLILGDDGSYAARWQYTDLHFGDELGRDVRTYELPDLEATIDVEDDGPHLRSIQFRYREPGDGYAAGGTDAYGPWQSVDMRPGFDPVWRQERARRALAGGMLLTAQIDQHICRGHLVPEVYSVAMQKYLSADHPVLAVLQPRLDEVDVVNFNADAMIWGPYGLLTCASAITSLGFKQRFRNRLAGMDWRGFQPRGASIHPQHYAPEVHRLYWTDVIVPYVDDALAGLAPAWSDAPTEALLRWKSETIAMFEAIRFVWPTFAPWDGVPRESWLDPSEFATGAPGEPAFSPVHTFEDVKAAIAFCVYHATMAHSWPNVRQMLAGGDPDYATFGLRERIDGVAPTGEIDTVWQDAASAHASDQLYALTVGHVLTELPVDTFDRELNGAVSGHFTDTLAGTDRALAARFLKLTDRLQDCAARSRFHGRSGLSDVRAYGLGYQLTRANR